MRTAARILPDLLPALPGVPIPMLDRALVRAAQDLCRRSRCWTIWTDPFQTMAGVSEYDIELPPQAQVVLIERATINGAPSNLVPSSFLMAAPEDSSESGVIVSRMQVHAPGIAPGQSVRLRVVLEPSDSAAGVPDEVFDPHSDLLAAGIRAQCMSIPGQSFTDIAMAQANAAAFGDGVSRACLQSWRGNTDGTKRARTVWC